MDADVWLSGFELRLHLLLKYLLHGFNVLKSIFLAASFTCFLFSDLSLCAAVSSCSVSFSTFCFLLFLISTSYIFTLNSSIFSTCFIHISLFVFSLFLAHSVCCSCFLLSSFLSLCVAASTACPLSWTPSRCWSSPRGCWWKVTRVPTC